jgi:outer membrane protein assembly factor BamB
MDAGDFDVEIGEIIFKKIKPFDRAWKIGEGGSIMFAQTEGSMAYFGACDGIVYCVNIMNGEESWRYRTGDRIIAKPYITNDLLIIGSFDKNVYCLDKNNGKLIWAFRTGGEIFSTADSEENRFYIGSRDGNLYCIDLTTGKEIWKFRTNGLIAGISVHENRIYFGSEDSNLYCIDFEGKEIWRFKAGDAIYDTPRIYNNKICFGCWDCHYYCIDLLTRRIQWRFNTSAQNTAYIPPPSESWEATVETKMDEKELSEAEEDRYAVNIQESGLPESEYVHKSGYAVKSKYG